MEIVWILVCTFELAVIIVLCTYISELKMNAAQRVSQLETRLYEATRNNLGRQQLPTEQEYSKRVSALLDMALRQR